MKNRHNKNLVYSNRKFYLLLLLLTIFQTSNMAWLTYSFNAKSDIPILSNNIDQLSQRMASMEAQLISTNQLLRDIRDDQRRK